MHEKIHALKKRLSPMEQAKFKELSISWELLLDFVETDIAQDFSLASTFILLFEDRLVLLDLSPQSTALTQKNLVLQNRKIQAVHPFALEDLQHLRIEPQVIGGLLVADMDIAGEMETVKLAHFSSSLHRSMAQFLSHIHALDEILKKEDMPEDPVARAEAIRLAFDERDEKSPHPRETFCPNCGRPYPQEGRAFCPHCLERGSVFSRLLKRFLQKPTPIIIFFVVLIFEGLLHSFVPWLTGTALYDFVLEQDFTNARILKPIAEGMSPLQILMWLLITLVLARAISSVFSVINGRIKSKLVPKLVANLRAEAFDNLQNLSLAFFTRRQTGSLMQRINQDADEVTVFFIEELPYFVFNIVTIIGSIYFMFQMNWKLAIIGVFLLPPTFIISFLRLPRLRVIQSQRSSATRRVYAVLNDTMQGARVLRAFGQEEEQGHRFQEKNYGLRDAERNVVLHQLKFQFPYYVARFLPLILIWAIGSWMIFSPDGNLTYGALISFTVYLNLLQEPLTAFSHAFIIWSNSMNAAQRIFEIIDATPEIQEVANPVDLDIDGSIEFTDVNFSYVPNKRVLKDINFKVEAGEMVGIVGKSGAGKSTFVNLIARLYDVDEGEVKIDGVNVKDLSFKSLRGQIAMVSQESYIFMGSVSENIAYGKPDASNDAIVNAAIAAHAHPFISSLPDGYDTLVGAGYRDLSGGEKQRVSIARAILLDPKILVLDEATSSVDTETERAIQNALDDLVKDRTTLSIAHRLSTLRDADRIMVLDDGKIVEVGTQDELLAKEGEYYRLYHLQSEALALKEEAEGLQDQTKIKEQTKESSNMSKQSQPQRSDAVEQSLRAIEEKIRIRKLTPENTTFEKTEGGFVTATIDGKSTPRIQVHRCFPFTAPDSWISIRENDENDGELGLIENLHDFDSETIAILEEQLELRYFMPTIKQVKKVKEEYGYAYWEVETDRGPIDFVMRTSSSSIMRLGKTRVIILDLDGNRYEIPDIDALPAVERRRFEMYI